MKNYLRTQITLYEEDKNYPIWRRQERRSKYAVQLASWQLRSNSPKTSVRLYTRFLERFEKTVGSIHFIPGIYPYGVSLLNPIHFCVPSLIFGPQVAKYLAENGVSGTFWKNYWPNSFHTWHIPLWGESLEPYTFSCSKPHFWPSGGQIFCWKWGFQNFLKKLLAQMGFKMYSFKITTTSLRNQWVNSLDSSDIKMPHKNTIIGSDNGLLPVPRQAIIWTNAAILSVRPQRIYFS